MKTLKTTAQIGAYGERIAVRYLRLHGYRIAAKNWRTGRYEIDIVAHSISDVAFVEVKTRAYTVLDDFTKPPKSAVDADKQAFTRQAARRYLAQFLTNKQPRMDVFEIFLLRKSGTDKYKVAKINHIKAAY